jgi:hypothetical protein
VEAWVTWNYEICWQCSCKVFGMIQDVQSRFFGTNNNADAIVTTILAVKWTVLNLLLIVNRFQHCAVCVRIGIHADCWNVFTRDLLSLPVLFCKGGNYFLQFFLKQSKEVKAKMFISDEWDDCVPWQINIIQRQMNRSGECNYYTPYWVWWRYMEMIC